ncbi:hypothetical protein [Thiomicrorhabdus sp. 6S3-12]|uniref:hypothetical protein n=1 Tax=Thiomicrorhabdus sp. 6S3-12 TaxID=2819681 RepID=UPI001AAC74C3|nr:hypothetical protein [Thiomicrorhabdus sp. 6S3-12]MBO1923010.1 hypothetical protein [Thiomicrorhabdus sp. 6S3-12]
MDSTSLQKLQDAKTLAQKFAAQVEADPQLKSSTADDTAKSGKQLKAKSNFTRKSFQPKISTYEKAFWRERLWLNPLLALSALLWFPFILQLFTDNLWFNLIPLLLFTGLEYWITRSVCTPLHTVQPPLWQRFMLLYALRRGAVVGALVLAFGALQKTGLPLIMLYTTAIFLYWVMQSFLYWQRRKFQRLQIAQLS